MINRVRRFFRRSWFFYAVRGWLLYKEGHPSQFLREEANLYFQKTDAPFEFQQLVARLSLLDETFSAAKLIAFTLANNKKPGPGVSSSSLNAFNAIWQGNRGVCSDYSQVFVGLCLVAGIRCREWSVCDDILRPTFGHSFNEIYSTEYSKWVLLDPYRSLYFIDQKSGIPVGVTELVDCITRMQGHTVTHVFIDEVRKSLGGASLQRVYFSQENVFTLLTNNRVFQQDIFYSLENLLPLPLVHGFMIIAGVYPRFAVYVNDHNRIVMEYKLKKKMTRES